MTNGDEEETGGRIEKTMILDPKVLTGQDWGRFLIQCSVHSPTSPGVPGSHAFNPKANFHWAPHHRTGAALA